jgi:membrane protease YdiL (CAAX protease family)
MVVPLDRSAVRSLRLLTLVAALLAITALASPWVTLALAGVGLPFKFSRVYDRVFEVLLVVAILSLWRSFDLGDATQIGLRQRDWLRSLGRGLAIGVVGVTAGLVSCWLGGALVPAPRFDLGTTLWKAAAGLLGAVIVGIGEEALFRGVLLRRLSADAGRPAGVLLSTVLYAVVHALRPGAREASAWAGVDRTVALFAPLGDPGVLPSVAGLFALGLLLVFARLRSGGLWLSIGIHAAFVAVFRVGRLLLDIRRTPAWLIGPGWPPLIGGAGGLVAIAVTFALLLVALRHDTRSPAPSSS